MTGAGERDTHGGCDLTHTGYVLCWTQKKGFGEHIRSFFPGLDSNSGKKETRRSFSNLVPGKCHPSDHHRADSISQGALIHCDKMHSIIKD